MKRARQASGRVVRALVLAVVFFSSSAYAARPDRAPSIDPIVRALGVDLDDGESLSHAHKEVAHRAGSRLISLCPDCRLATIDEEGPCGWARTNRRIIQAAVAKGMDEESIVAAYVKTYGPEVLAVDTSQGRYQTMWIVPYLCVAGGLGIVGFVGYRARRRRDEEVVEPEVVEAGEAREALERELAALD